MSGGEKERLMAFKNKIKDLELQLQDKSNLVDQYQAVGNVADQKMADQNHIHGEKVRSLMNSIQMLKKENAKMKELSKQHKRSQLIEQLNVEIRDQDIVITALRKLFNNDAKCDSAIVSALNEGPPQIKALSREELKVENRKLNQLLLNAKAQCETLKSGAKVDLNDSQLSKASTVHSQPSSAQPIDTNDHLIRRMKELKNENEDLLLNLKAEEEIRVRYEEEISRRGVELQDLKGAKVDLLVLTKKYEVMQRQLDEHKEFQKGHEVHQLNKDLQIEELQIIGKTQESKQQLLERKHQMEVEEMALQMEQAQQEREDVSQEHQKAQVKHSDLNKRFNDIQGKFMSMRDQNNKINTDIESKTGNYEQIIEELRAKQQQIESDLADRESTLVEANIQIETLLKDNDELTYGLKDLLNKLSTLKSPDSSEEQMNKQIQDMLKKHDKEINPRDIELAQKLKGQREYYEQTIREMQRKLLLADKNHAQDIENVSSDVSKLLDKHDHQQNLDGMSSNFSQSVLSKDELYGGHFGLIQNEKINMMNSGLQSILDTEEQKIDPQEYKDFDSQVSFTSSLLEQEKQLLKAPKSMHIIHQPIVTKKEQYKQIQHISQMDSSVGSMISKNQRDQNLDALSSNVSGMSLKSRKSSLVNQSQISKLSSNVSSMKGSHNLQDVSSDLSLQVRRQKK